ncbi:ABC transporter ATP-binding protein [Marinobacterium lutimaris]|uniref:Iron complex transport system ATP-binding protein n=1 Tax=Marinobacterium lutimaris TaxID=568106 RepID=A0A1H5Z4I8_9GAMM|nr:ABC transporter ATP-binding protein [Marinobacterium lutimaris]SEG30276.1 iron complex transport system ATP-binding protein [Marinobacterium lutimaris]
MLELKQLSVEIDRRQIVKPLDLTLDSGASLALLGRNGAGKSTVVKAIAGLIRAQGEVLIDGMRLRDLSMRERSRLIGYVAQEFSASDVRLSVFELLLLAQNSQNMRFRADPQSLARASQMLSLLGLEHLAERQPTQMSGGQRQMVALALALIRRPRLLLLDEPTSALDMANQFQLLDTVRQYTREHEITTLMVLHDLNLAHRYADQTLLLEAGDKVALGATEAILNTERIAQTYGVHCELLRASDGSLCVHPMAAL